MDTRFLFSALAIRAVGKAAYYVINEVRRQFKENPGILQGTAKPDYARCVDIVTVGALKEMILPGLIAVGTPIAVGLIFRLLGVGAEAAHRSPRPILGWTRSAAKGPRFRSREARGDHPATPSRRARPPGRWGAKRCRSPPSGRAR